MFLLFTDLEIWSTADWDAGHPAGTPLDDIVRFESDTPWPYIRSGYTQRYSDKKRGEYYPVHCLVSELTADDMTLLPDYFLSCLPRVPPSTCNIPSVSG